MKHLRKPTPRTMIHPVRITENQYGGSVYFVFLSWQEAQQAIKRYVLESDYSFRKVSDYEYHSFEEYVMHERHPLNHFLSSDEIHEFDTLRQACNFIEASEHSIVD